MKLKLNKKWKWAAMDKDEMWYVYDTKPSRGRFCWYVIGKMEPFTSYELFDVPKVKDWKKSLRRIT